jgi:error-prone DNA polymerase
VEVRPLDLRHSGWDCHLEEGPTGAALRLGLRLLKGLREEAVRRMEALRGERPFQDLSDLARRGPFHQGELSALARAGALAGFGEDRRQLLWAVEGLYHLPLFRGLARQEEGPAPLSAPTSREELAEDYALVGLSVQHDPVRMARPQLRQQGVRTAVELDGLPAGRLVKVAGIISHRQRPGTASGMLFMTMEDETGMLNLVVKPQLFEAQRGLILGSNLLRTTARLQRDGQALSLLCLGFEPFPEAPEVETHSRDFR